VTSALNMAAKATVVQSSMIWKITLLMSDAGG
jgi:hypothetical protein